MKSQNLNPRIFSVFGTAFRDVALKIKVTILSHGFTHSVIEVAQPDVKRLLEYVHPI